MDIRTVRFEAFKSLYDVRCDLDHLTVLTGPNGAGKSNFVDGLNFLGEVYAHGLEYAVSRAGGFDNIAHRRTRRAKRPIRFEVEVVLRSQDLTDGDMRLFLDIEPGLVPKGLELTYRHVFAIQTAGQSARADFRVVEDSVSILGANRNPLFNATISLQSEGLPTIELFDPKTPEGQLVAKLVTPFEDRTLLNFLAHRKTTSTGLVSEILRYPNIFGHMFQALGGIRVFQLSPYQCRTPGVPTPNATLDRHGENLPGAADYLQRNNRVAWRQIQSAMRSILPDLIDIEVVYTEDRRLALQFREKGLGRAWSTGEVSDGTIQTLALLVSLFDSRSPMMVIEEPENSIHPWILRQYIDTCMRASSKQLLLTTHSPVLLNYVDPGIVRVMSLSGGRSKVQRLVDLTPEMGELITSGEVTLFDAYDSGALDEAVPRGLSALTMAETTDE